MPRVHNRSVMHPPKSVTMILTFWSRFLLSRAMFFLGRLTQRKEAWPQSRPWRWTCGTGCRDRAAGHIVHWGPNEWSPAWPGWMRLDPGATTDTTSCTRSPSHSKYKQIPIGCVWWKCEKKLMFPAILTYDFNLIKMSS